MTELELGIERLTALGLIAAGMSHIAAPHSWVRFFSDMREHGSSAGLYNAYVHGPLGFLIVAFHQVWSGPGLVVTLFGCALTVKGFLYFVWPALAERTLARVNPERAWQFQVAGAFALVLGIVVAWLSLR